MPNKHGPDEDLEWLGLKWETPVRVQSDHMAEYQDAITKLSELGVLYPCFCTRKEILEEIERAGYAPHGPEGAIYPGICRDIKRKAHNNDEYALRLNLDKALNFIQGSLFWIEKNEEIAADPAILGDVVVARKDIGTSYHLSVVVDDALQGITHITRGEDLKYATNIQRVLQKLLNVRGPIYNHHPLINDDKGERLAKRNQSHTLRHYRKAGKSPDDIYQIIGINPLD